MSPGFTKVYQRNPRCPTDSAELIHVSSSISNSVQLIVVEVEASSIRCHAVLGYLRNSGKVDRARLNVLEDVKKLQSFC